MEKNTYYTGKVADIVAAYRAAKSAKAKVNGFINLAFTDTMDGLNVRSVYGDAKKMGRLMDEFTDKFKVQLATPYIDTEFKALVATNGASMILCDIPDGMTKDDAILAGFKWNIGCALRWWSVIRDREVTDYNLANLKRIAVIRKGDAIHNLLMGLAECAKAYEHEDKDGCFHTIYCWFENKLYNVRAVADIVTGVFKLGNTEIRLCEQVGYAGWYSAGYTPMHIVGMDGKNNSRGLVMPVRHYGMTDGAFVFPTEEKAVNAA